LGNFFGADRRRGGRAGARFKLADARDQMAHGRLEFVHLDEREDQEDKRRQKQQHPETNNDVVHQRLTIRWDNR
jgi:hypothetical protein